MDYCNSLPSGNGQKFLSGTKTRAYYPYAGITSIGYLLILEVILRSFWLLLKHWGASICASLLAEILRCSRFGCSKIYRWEEMCLSNWTPRLQNEITEELMAYFPDNNQSKTICINNHTFFTSICSNNTLVVNALLNDLWHQLSVVLKGIMNTNNMVYSTVSKPCYILTRVYSHGSRHARLSL